MFRQHVDGERSVFPEYRVHSRLQMAQRMRSQLTKPEHYCRTHARSCQPLYRIGLRKPVSAEEFPDFVVGGMTFNIGYPEHGH